MPETIQDCPDLLDYVNAQIHPLHRCGSFLEFFFNACLRADWENWPLLKPVLLEFVKKYPADEHRLEMERRDRGL